MRVQSLSQEDPLEKRMAIHSSTLAWEIPWTEGPGWLQSVGPQNSWTQLNNSAAAAAAAVAAAKSLQSCPTLCDPIDGSPPGFPAGAVARSLPARAGDTRDAGSIPESGRSP